MRALWTILALFSASPALAQSRLKMVADRPVVIVVNMVPHTVGTEAPNSVDFPKGKEGTQRITVRNMLGQVVYQGQIVVPRDFVVTVAWRDRQLEVVDRRLLKTSEPFNNGKRSSGGKRNLAGHKELDDLAKTTDEGAGDLLSLAASDADAGEGQDTGLGVVVNELEPGEQQIAEPEGGSSTERTGKGTGESVESTVLSGGDAADAAVIRLVPRSQSWANVWIGDQKVWEYRGKGDVLEVRLPAGAHTIAVKDFRDRDGWGTGTLTLGASETASVHFSMSQPIETQGGNWAPDK